MVNSFAKFLLNRDIYGVPITVVYKGDSVFKTYMGAAFTLLTHALLLVNVINLTQSYSDGSK